MPNLYEKILNFNLKARLSQRIKRADKPFWCAFFSSFIALNLVFLYHGAHFMFGDHDWKYLKNGIALTDGLFEGRFTQFILVNLLSFGEILPIINNVIGFFGFSLGLALLAKYWQIPHNKLSYSLFALFTALSPYILSFMYFAFLIIPVLFWSVFILAALMISERESTFSPRHSLSAILCIIIALGGYPPVLNLLSVALTVRLLFILQDKKITFLNALKSYRYTFLNIIIALVGYKLCLIYLTHLGVINDLYYNLQTTPINEWGTKLWLVFKDMFLEFGATLPFITGFYKLCLSFIAILALISLIKNKLPAKRRLLNLFIYILTYLSGLVTLFLSTSLRETEFSPRIDFFGFMYAIAGAFALLLQCKNQWLKNLTYLTATICIIYSANTLFEAQKVWQLGYTTEMRLYQRIGKRFKANEIYNPYGHYIMVQGGSPAFRERFYHTPYRYKSDDLLSISYVPAMASGVMWDYFSAHDYIDKTAYVYTFQPDYTFIEHLKQAKPWPDITSVAVGSYWILVLLDDSGIANLKQLYLQ